MSKILKNQSPLPAVVPAKEAVIQFRTSHLCAPLLVVPAKAGTQGFQSLAPGSPLSRGRRTVRPQDFLIASKAGIQGAARPQPSSLGPRFREGDDNPS
jgi:hypothetical protein